MDNKKLEQVDKKSKLIACIKDFIIYALIIGSVLLIRIYVVTPIRVDGDSMNDNLHNKDILLLKKYDHTYERFDIVVFKRGNSYLIKRVIGLPGEHITYYQNKLYVDDEYVEENMIDNTTGDFDLSMLGFEVIPDDYYFVLGDNRNNSTDSRIIGLISKDDIIGSTNFILFPFNKFGKINK